jgi:hypothetical protein
MRKTLLRLNVTATAASLALAISLGACRGSSDSVEEAYRTVTYADCCDASMFDSIAEPTAVIIPKLGEGVFIGRIQRAVFADSMYVLVDDYKQVIGIDAKGNQRFVIHKIGQGPGEYVDLADVALDCKNSQLLVLADTKIMFYDLSGHYLGREIQVDEYCSELQLQGDVAYLLMPVYANNVLKNTSILTVNIKDGETHSYMKPLEQYAPHCSLESSFLTNDQAGNVYMTRMFDENVYRLLPDSYEVEMRVDWNSHRFVPEEGVQYDCMKLFRSAWKDDKMYAIYNVQRGRSYTTLSGNCPGGLCFVDKQGVVRRIPSIVDATYHAGLMTPIPVANSNGQLLFAMEAMNLAKQATFPNASDNLKQLMTQINDESNPVLFVYTLK